LPRKFRQDIKRANDGATQTTGFGETASLGEDIRGGLLG